MMGWVVAAVFAGLALRFWLDARHWEDSYRDALRCWDRTAKLYEDFLDKQRIGV